MYKIFQTNQFLKDLEKIKVYYRKILPKKLNEFVFPQLKSNPYFGKNIKKLVNYNPSTWRFRLGNLRLFYEICPKRKIIFLLTLQERKIIF